ncbi:MAG TPA: hypothetical protein VMF08_02720 [Candidatus Sulfotelmatobacter sp.]|nr:hypothetical protein [Candidatus Sulfotelmatobacter sp.]
MPGILVIASFRPKKLANLWNNKKIRKSSIAAKSHKGMSKICSIFIAIGLSLALYQVGIVISSQLLNWRLSGISPDWMFSVKQGVGPGAHNWNPLHLWPVIFANAGSLVLLPWMLWRRVRVNRDWPVVAVCGAFIAFQTLNDLAWGVYSENRDWLELSPIAWILISELFLPGPSDKPANNETAPNAVITPEEGNVSSA